MSNQNFTTEHVKTVKADLRFFCKISQNPGLNCQIAGYTRFIGNLVRKI